MLVLVPTKCAFCRNDVAGMGRIVQVKKFHQRRAGLCEYCAKDPKLKDLINKWRDHPTELNPRAC